MVCYIGHRTTKFIISLMFAWVGNTMKLEASGLGKWTRLSVKTCPLFRLENLMSMMYSLPVMWSCFTQPCRTFLNMSFVGVSLLPTRMAFAKHHIEPK